MTAEAVSALIGEPDYASIESFGGFSGGQVDLRGIRVELPPTERWTGRVCRYNSHSSGSGGLRKSHFFELVYHKKADGGWGLNNWEWKDEYID